jgi:hypothetical protein
MRIILIVVAAAGKVFATDKTYGSRTSNFLLRLAYENIFT